MMIHKIAPPVDLNQWLKRLNNYLDESTNQNSLKSPKIVKPTNKKRYYETLWTSVINSPLSPPSLKKNSLNSFF